MKPVNHACCESCVGEWFSFDGIGHSREKLSHRAVWLDYRKKEQRSPNSESTESMLIDAHPPIFEYVYSSILTLHMEAIGFQHQSTTKFCVDSVTCVPFYRITHRSNSNMSTYDDGFLNSAPTLALTYIHYPEITIANPIAHDTVHSSVKWWRRNVCCFVFLFCSARYIL